MEQLVEDMNNFGTANWILLACIGFVMLLLIILVIVNIKIMKKYRMDLTRTRLARVNADIQLVNGWCAIVVSNTGQVAATNLKLKAKGSIMDYYYNYITKCRVDNVYKKMLNKKFTLAPGAKKKIALFPISEKAQKSIMSSRVDLITPSPDVNLIGRVDASSEVEIEQVFDKDDSKVLNAVKKEQAKIANKQEKQNTKTQAKLDKLDAKRQNEIRKQNKKDNRATHTSVIEQPDMKKLFKKANIKMTVTYESLGYRFKNKKFNFKNIDLNEYPAQVSMLDNVMTAQNELLSQIIYLQKQIYQAANMKDEDFE